MNLNLGGWSRIICKRYIPFIFVFKSQCLCLSTNVYSTKIYETIISKSPLLRHLLILRYLFSPQSKLWSVGRQRKELVVLLGIISSSSNKKSIFLLVSYPSCSLFKYKPYLFIFTHKKKTKLIDFPCILSILLWKLLKNNTAHLLHATYFFLMT